MTNYEDLAAEIRAKRHYRETEDGTIYCNQSGCMGSQGLRCYRTNVPICKKCAVRAPVGYLSKEAARDQQDQFFNIESTDYLLAGGTAFIVNLGVGLFAVLIGSALWGVMGFFGIVLMAMIATSAAGIVSEAVWRVLRKRRGRYTHHVITGAVVISSLPFLLVNFFVGLIYLGVVASAVYTRFQMNIRL